MGVNKLVVGPLWDSIVYENLSYNVLEPTSYGKAIYRSGGPQCNVVFSINGRTRILTGSINCGPPYAGNAIECHVNPDLPWGRKE